MRKFAALALASFLLGGSSLPDDPDLQSLTLSRRFAYALCTGLCASYDLTIRPNGSVDVQQHLSFKGHYSFQVAKSTAHAAIATVSQLRPDAQQSSHPCAVPAEPASELFDPNVVQFAIEWRGGRRAERLVFCAEDKDAVAVFNSALSALGLNAIAHPLMGMKNGTPYRHPITCDLGGGRWSPPRYDCESPSPAAAAEQ